MSEMPVSYLVSKLRSCICDLDVTGSEKSGSLHISQFSGWDHYIQET